MKKRKNYNPKVSVFFPILTFTCVGVLFIFSNYYTPKWNFKWEGIRKEVKDSIVKFDKYGMLSYTDVDQIKRQRWVLNNLTSFEYNKLLYYPSGEVQAMCYAGLMKNSTLDKYHLFKKSLNDTLTFVTVNSGCFINEFMISDYVINQITNLSGNYPPIFNRKIEYNLTLEERNEILNLYKERKIKEDYYKEEFHKSIR
ncbi:hypothetical protein [Tenacibaculum agarivorans]|uniref:hypothetical protein n=1 Tax=Tenacibaculum agarivorans TaxID=1908389 RepID=UPI00094B9726|nr:hypothetical protein [Tenacibaculum agarivorans]